MNERTKELAEQAGFVVGVSANADRQINHFAELIRADEREANIKIIKRLRPEIVGTPNDPKTHQKWCESAALFSNFESIIAAIRQRGKQP